MAPRVKPAMPNFDHVCVRRPCLLCALDNGDPLPAHTHLVDRVSRKVLPWRARDEGPDVSRLARKIASLSPPLREAVEQFVDECVNDSD